MEAIRRVLLVLLGLLVMGTGIFLLAAIYMPFGGYGSGLIELYGRNALLYAGGALTVAGLIPILIGFSSPPRPKPETLLQVGEFGEVRITLSALENMVLRVVQQVRGIRDSSRSVAHTPHGLVVYLTVKVLPDQNLPDLSAELQRKVKEYLEDITGIIVNEVKVKIENIILDQAPIKVK